MPKDNNLFIRMDDEDARILNNGWFDYVNYVGHPVTKSDYIRQAFRVMLKYMNGEVVDKWEK